MNSDGLVVWDSIAIQFNGGVVMENYFKNMNTRVPSEPILLLIHQLEKLSIH